MIKITVDHEPTSPRWQIPQSWTMRDAWLGAEYDEHGVTHPKPTFFPFPGGIWIAYGLSGRVECESRCLYLRTSAPGDFPDDLDEQAATSRLTYVFESTPMSYLLRRPLLVRGPVPIGVYAENNFDERPTVHLSLLVVPVPRIVARFLTQTV